MRRQAGANLGLLAALSPRVDQLAGEQLASALHAAEPGLKEGYAAALRGCVSSVRRPGYPTLSRPRHWYPALCLASTACRAQFSRLCLSC